MPTIFTDFNDATDGFVMAWRGEAPDAAIGDLVTVTDNDTLTMEGRVFAIERTLIEIELLPGTTNEGNPAMTITEDRTSCEMSFDIKGRNVTVELVHISRDIAAEMLTHNTHNRSLKKKHMRYAEDIAADAWSFTGAPITFSEAGTLLDGQNRLHAIVLAGEKDPTVTVPTLVIRGLDASAQDDTDTGVNRKLQDILILHGEENAATLAAVLRLIHGWNIGARRNLGSGSDFTNPQLLRTLEAHPEARLYAEHETRRIADECGLAASVVGLTRWLFDRIDPIDSEFFFRRLAEETGHNKGEPIYELRRTIKARTEATATGRRSGIDRVWMIVVTIKAWNAYRDGVTVGNYRWSPGGAKPERFPEPH